MDFLKKLEGEATNKPTTTPQNPSGTQSSSTGGGAGTEDYGDKGLDFAEKKLGYTQSRETNEKITDGARGLFEKFSGKKVDSKYSN